MNYQEKPIILNNFVKTKWTTIHITNSCNVSYNGYEPYLVFYLNGWYKYKELLEEYSHKQLSDYLIEIIRIKLPELKGTRLYITPYSQSCILFNEPKSETDKYLYII